MRLVSPLRYPGGKSAMTDLLAKTRQLNGLGGRAIAEPFAGGAGASLSLLCLEDTHEIHINDADPAIYDFWWSLLNRSDDFLEMITGARLSMAEWRRQRNVYRQRERMSRLRRGFSAFYLNRCNRSGIIASGGPIGGLKQAGEWKLDARFNKIELSRRCKTIAAYRERIHVSRLDGLEAIKALNHGETFYFIDPPYYAKGPTLYLNALDHAYHEALAAKLKSMQDAAWVLTYDDCPRVRAMYRDWARIRPFTLRYNAAERRSGREVLIVPRWIRLPSAQTSEAIAW